MTLCAKHIGIEERLHCQTKEENDNGYHEGKENQVDMSDIVRASGIYSCPDNCRSQGVDFDHETEDRRKNRPGY